MKQISQILDISWFEIKKSLKKPWPLPFVGIHCMKKLKWWFLGWVFQNWPPKLHKRSLCNKMLLLDFIFFVGTFLDRFLLLFYLQPSNFTTVFENTHLNPKQKGSKDTIFFSSLIYLSSSVNYLSKSNYLFCQIKQPVHNALINSLELFKLFLM